MFDSSLPALNNVLLALCLFGFLGIAHCIAHKCNILDHKDMRNRLHVAWAIALIGLPAVLYPKSLGLVLWAIIPLLAWQEWIAQVHVRDKSQTKI